MEIKKQKVLRYILSGHDDLDDVTMIIEDTKSGHYDAPCRGKVTLECYGQSWSAFWGAMGGDSVLEFIDTTNVGYLVGCLDRGLSSTVFDFEKITDAVRKLEGCEDVCIEENNALVFDSELARVYGPDWRGCLPEIPNPKHEYLCRIVKAVKEAVPFILEDEAKG